MQLTEPTRVLLIDDHHLFNDGLKSLLAAQPDLNVCGQVYTPAEVFLTIQRTKPHLILLDINLQGTSGIELGRKILADYPHIRVLMLTMYNQVKLLEETRRAGLHGYLLKDATTAELLRGIRAVLSGEGYFDTTIVPADQPDAFSDDFAKRLNLTFREVEIIRLIRQELSNEQIADRIHISIQTIKTHRRNIYFKLGINSVVDLIQFAIRNGL